MSDHTEIIRLNRILRGISEADRALMRARSEQELLESICNIIVDVGGYNLAWIGRVEKGANKIVKPISWAGKSSEYLKDAKVEWGDTPLGQGPTGIALRSGVVSVVHDTRTDPKFEPWRAVALERGYLSTMAFPLISNGKPFGVIAVYNKEANTINDEEIRLFSNFADNIVFGIETLRNEERRVQAEAALRSANDELEARVIERTGELAHANDELAQAYEDLQSTLQELKVKQKEVLRSEKLSSLGKMVAGFAHELNNPLMGLRAYIDVIEEICPTGTCARDVDAVEAIEKAGKTVERLTRIVKNILHHTTVQEFQFTAFNVKPSVSETVQLFSVGSMDHDLIVNVNIGDNLPPVWCDDSSLKQIVLNILINARDAVADSKEKIIELTASANEEYVSIKVSDTGTGIPDEYMAKVFDPFFTSKDPGKGTGLGLSVSNDLMGIIKGKMRCQNRAEGGAEFIVDVPIYKQIESSV